MPGLLDKLQGFVEGQKQNWATARERQAGGGVRNPFLKTAEEQAAMATQRADATPSPSLDYAPRQEIKEVTNRALADQMSAQTPDAVAGTAGMSFNPEDSDSVLAMQRVLNSAGIKDKYGEALSEDGKMGPKTLSALRSMQESRGQFIGPEGSDVNALNQDYQEDHGRLAQNKNPLMTAKNWWDSLTKRTPEEGHIPEYNPRTSAAGPGGRMGSYKPPKGGGGRMY